MEKFVLILFLFFCTYAKTQNELIQFIFNDSTYKEFDFQKCLELEGNNIGCFYQTSEKYNLFIYHHPQIVRVQFDIDDDIYSMYSYSKDTNIISYFHFEKELLYGYWYHESGLIKAYKYIPSSLNKETKTYMPTGFFSIVCFHPNGRIMFSYEGRSMQKKAKVYDEAGKKIGRIQLKLDENYNIIVTKKSKSLNYNLFREFY